MSCQFVLILFAAIGALRQKGNLGRWWSQLWHKAEDNAAQVDQAAPPAAPADAFAEPAKPAS